MDKDLAANLFGATPEEMNPPTELLPDVWPSFEIFVDCATQWRVGVNGATGIDYNVLPMLYEFRGVKDTRQVFADIKAMEAEALKMFAEMSDA